MFGPSGGIPLATKLSNDQTMLVFFYIPHVESSVGFCSAEFISKSGQICGVSFAQRFYSSLNARFYCLYVYVCRYSCMH